MEKQKYKKNIGGRNDDVKRTTAEKMQKKEKNMAESEKKHGKTQESPFVDVIILGAGASGLAAAVAAARQGCRVTAMDGNEKAGKKLYATGNGRCNFTNANCTPESFNDPSDDFVKSVFQKFGTEETLNFFQKEGMMARLEEGGRYYPYSGQASAVVRTLKQAAERAGCRFVFGDKAAEVVFCGDSSDDGYFSVRLASGKELHGKNLIVACGGRASLKTGSTGDGYGFAKSFGHTLVPPRPALTAAESDAEYLTKLKGVRVKGRAALYVMNGGKAGSCLLSEDSADRTAPAVSASSEEAVSVKWGRKIAEEPGEIQFTGTGISGICVFDLTRFMDGLQPPQKKKKKSGGKSPQREEAQRKYTILCDFVPEMGEDQLNEILQTALDSLAKRPVSCEDSMNLTDSADFGYPEHLANALAGIVNDRLAEVIAELAEGDRQRAAQLLKGFFVPVSHTRGWDEAQVTCGGIPRDQLDGDTLESKLQPGLYFCGEVIDVDGRCGGFNLQWAWSSGVTAGCAAAKREKQRKEKKDAENQSDQVKSGGADRSPSEKNRAEAED